MPSRVRSTSASWSGLLTSQPLCGSRRSRAPLAPPRLSLPRNVEADAHAVDTSWRHVRPEARTSRLSPATSSASTSSWSTAGTGSCQISTSDGTSGPSKRTAGPMSRWVSLYHARAYASENAAWSSLNRREIGS